MKPIEFDPEKPADGIERRLEPRFAVELPGLFKEIESLDDVDFLDDLPALGAASPLEDVRPARPGEPPIPGRTRNISASGAMVDLERSVQPESWIQLNCQLGDAALEIRAKVLACDPTEPEIFCTRVQFLHMDTTSQALLDAFIEDWQKDHGPEP